MKNAMDVASSTVPRASDLIRKYYGAQSGQTFMNHVNSSLDPRCGVTLSTL